jgi:UDP-N-acetylglucosamine 4,6-dehydratase
MTRFWITLDQGIDFVMMALRKANGGEIFVPKIPSMRLTDLIQAVAPDCKTIITGIRPGEKLHECMIGEDDAPYTYEHQNHFTIYPAIHNWYQDIDRSGSDLVSEGFRYTSDRNTDWMTPDVLSKMLAKYKLVGPELVYVDEISSPVLSGHESDY